MAASRCAGGRVVSTAVDHDGTTTEDRTPQEQVKAWASVEKPEVRGETRVVYRDDDSVQLALADARGRTVAVLSYEKSDPGWILQTIDACA